MAYNITATLYNCTADEENPTTIETTATLIYHANNGYPFNAFGVEIKNATGEVTLSSDKKTITINLSEPTANVTATVEAKINSTVNQRYVVKNGQLYCIFNERNKSVWDKKWIREDMIKNA